MTIVRTPTEAARAQMAPLARLPIFLSLDDRRAVVAGGSDAAAWKAELLSAAGATVDVFAQAPCDALRRLASDPPKGAIAVHPRGWRDGDLEGAAIAVGAFTEDERAAAFAQAARTARVPVNVIDKPDYCDFSFGAIVNRSPLVIGISTDGGAPVFAQAIRAKIEALLPMGFSAWAAAAARWRKAVKASGLPFAGRRRFWELFTAHAVRRPASEPMPGDFERLIAEVKGEGAKVEQGSVTLVGAGPGNAELLTLRAVRALQAADVILFDNLVSRDVLDFARREAKKLLVGKSGFGPSCDQEDINALFVGLAKQGKRVVRLKGGDPLIFGRAGEEIEACHAHNIRVEVVPGISAAQAAAASLALPLTDRNHARRLQYVTGHAKDGRLPDDIDWKSLADPATTTAIYMPTRTLAALIARATAEGLDPRTPAVAVSRASLADQAVVAAPFGELAIALAKADLTGPVLVMLGRVIADGACVARPEVRERA